MNALLLPALRRACADGVLASLFSGLALLRGSRSDLAHLVGRSEYRVGRPPLKSSAADIALHAATGLVWGALYDRVRAMRQRPTPANAITDALLLTAVAVGVDRVVTPSVLTPGADKRATASGTRPPSAMSLLMVYGGFAAGLALGGLHALRDAPARDDDPGDAADYDEDFGVLADLAPRRASGRA
ncbi:hypothetical protein [Mitsuaria sp. GD03876]|uniref:hypothetical protein n=1 Tax=Mitsuaria sp. GD03876 TaxID=2975399 RepID=UPI00244D1651|nr:hypothetical protein [Mitsuaria sp. GD03876]MDH0866095.1 hypothetical protein [Mitsuaria sp. GD03876]